MKFLDIDLQGIISSVSSSVRVTSKQGLVAVKKEVRKGFELRHTDGISFIPSATIASGCSWAEVGSHKHWIW